MSWTHALLIIVLMIAAAFVPALGMWPLFWIVPLLAYAAIVAAVPPLRASFRPWRFGRVSAGIVAATAIISVGACAVLVAFHSLKQPDIRDFGRFLPVHELGGIVVFGVLFSIFNAPFEEVIFRGILFDAVESHWGAWGALLVTALLFGYGHMHGYPPGPLGAVLAGIYGLCLGWLRMFSGGLGPAIISHIAADATIYTIVARAGVL